MTWIAIGLGEVRRKDERFTPLVPLWSRQWTSRCRRPRKLFYIDVLLIFSRHDLPSASRRRKMLPCTEEEVEALFYFIYNLYLTLYPIRTLSTPFPNFTAVHGVGVAQAKPACKHTIATRKCYQYNKRRLLVGTALTARCAVLSEAEQLCHPRLRVWHQMNFAIPSAPPPPPLTCSYTSSLTSAFTQISTAGYSQVLIYTAVWTDASWRERNVRLVRIVLSFVHVNLLPLRPGDKGSLPFGLVGSTV